MMDALKSLFKAIFRRWEDRPADQMFYVKMFFAFISAVVCGAYGTAFAGIRGIMFGFLVYVLSLYVIVYLLEVEPEQLGGRQKLVTDSLVSYLLLWVLLWTLLYAFTTPPSIYESLLFVAISSL